MVILNEDPYQVDPMRLKDIEILATIMDGNYTYQFDDQSAELTIRKAENTPALPGELKGCNHGNHQH
jgi:hypothetical protein